MSSFYPPPRRAEFIRRAFQTGSRWMAAALLALLPASCQRAGDASRAPTSPNLQARAYAATGEVRQVAPDGRSAVIAHRAIPNLMAAMTMRFKVKDSNELAGVTAGDEIAFRLWVSPDESWIDHLSKTGRKRPPIASNHPENQPPPPPPPAARESPLNYEFTNELGHPMSLSQFRGQALAVTFFFTRCPIPDYCPRLSKNFEEASSKLAAMPNAPTNWHFLSVTFDPETDTPAVLKAYAERYHYDPKRWNFLTGPPEKIQELAQQAGVETEREGALISHNFRTLIINAAGHLQMVFPVSGNLSDAIVSEMLKAMAPLKGSQR